MLPSRLANCLAAVLAFAQTASAAQAAEIPAKYHGVYVYDGEGRSCQKIRDSDYWFAVTAKTTRGHESYCTVIAARRNVKRNEDELTFRCFAEGEKSINKEAWSLKLESQDGEKSKNRDAYLLMRIIGPGAINSDVYRKKKCPPNVRPPY